MADIPNAIAPPIIVDEDGAQTDAFDFIQSFFPNWKPNDSNLETWKIGAFARMMSEVADYAQDIPDGIFKYLGQSILGIPAIAAGPSSVHSTWTFSDNPAGRTVAAGTLVAIDGSDGTPVAFEVVADVVVASPTLTTPVDAVVLRAVDPGADTNGLGGAAVVVFPLDPVVWVDTITLSGPTTGGVDEETDADYLDRLSARLTTFTARPILPRDYEVLGRDLAEQAGVEVQALALDGYNPDDFSTGNERYVTLVLKDAVTGADVSGGLKTLIDDELQALREVNFVVRVIDPDRTTVDVTFTITPTPGADGATAVADAIANVTDFLSPAKWGLPPGPDASGWVQKDTLFRQDISTVINNTLGVDHWDVLTIGLNGGAQTAAESFALTGAAPVAEPGVIDGSLT